MASEIDNLLGAGAVAKGVEPAKLKRKVPDAAKTERQAPHAARGASAGPDPGAGAPGADRILDGHSAGPDLADTRPAVAQATVIPGLTHSIGPDGLTTASYPGQQPYTGVIMPRQPHWAPGYACRAEMTPDQLRADDAKAERIKAGIREQGAAFDRGEVHNVPSNTGGANSPHWPFKDRGRR